MNRTSRRLLAIVVCVLLPLALVTSLGTAVRAQGPGSVYSEHPIDDHYSFVDKGCGLTVEVKGHATGHQTIYNVPGSHRTAFLEDITYRYHETWTNPRSGRQASAEGRVHYTELRAWHIRGDIWGFLTKAVGRPFTVKDYRGHTIQDDGGVIVTRQVFDTRGDHKPGGKVLKEKILTVKGHFPSWEKSFDFCGLVRQAFGKH